MKNYIKCTINFDSYAMTTIGTVKEEDTTIVDIYCVRGSEKLYVEGQTVTLYGIRNNYEVMLEQTEDILTKDNRITIKLKDSYVKLNDSIIFELLLVDPSGNEMTSPKFKLIIDLKITGEPTIQATTEIKALQKAMQVATEFEENLEALKDAGSGELERQANEEVRISAELERENTIDTFKAEYAEMKPILEDYTKQLVVTDSEIDAIIANALS